MSTRQPWSMSETQKLWVIRSYGTVEKRNYSSGRGTRKQELNMIRIVYSWPMHSIVPPIYRVDHRNVLEVAAPLDLVANLITG